MKVKADYFVDELPPNMCKAAKETIWSGSSSFWNMTFKGWVDRIERMGLMTDDVVAEIAAVLLCGKDE